MKELTKKSARSGRVKGQTSISKYIYIYLAKRKRQRLKMEGLYSGNWWRGDDDNDDDYDDDDEEEVGRRGRRPIIPVHN